jgi:hypothetical protein
MHPKRRFVQFFYSSQRATLEGRAECDLRRLYRSRRLNETQRGCKKHRSGATDTKGLVVHAEDLKTLNIIWKLLWISTVLAENASDAIVERFFLKWNNCSALVDGFSIPANNGFRLG